MIEPPTPHIAVSATPGGQVLAVSSSFRQLVGSEPTDDRDQCCSKLLCCGNPDPCHAEACPLVKVFRSEEKYLENVPVWLRCNGDLVPAIAQFRALWEPWGSYVSVWFGPPDAYE